MLPNYKHKENKHDIDIDNEMTLTYEREIVNIRQLLPEAENLKSACLL